MVVVVEIDCEESVSDVISHLSQVSHVFQYCRIQPGTRPIVGSIKCQKQNSPTSAIGSNIKIPYTEGNIHRQNIMMGESRCGAWKSMRVLLGVITAST